ncbi:hypothetical protein AUR64_00285 [Haloprofundus marisrubri]|uniref:UspA domain-containing protein n=2 Tax=Haloprofundus marisrubri TaxID=1514971 RepID=A0A0W1RET5_9EURY|nr:hypothetical protein AUR64_00285 [Haloprofundus marisrubri]
MLAACGFESKKGGSRADGETAKLSNRRPKPGYLTVDRVRSPMSEPKLLVPVRLSSFESLPPTLTETLSALPVVVLGYEELDADETEQSVSESRRAQLQSTLDGVAADFESGANVETVLTVTHDRAKAIDRVAVDHDCDIILVPNDVSVVGRVLVAVKNADHIGEVGSLLSTLNRREIGLGNLVHVTLLHVAESDDEMEASEQLLAEAKATLADNYDIDELAIETRVRRGEDPGFEIIEAARDHDAVVMGETTRDIERDVFGTVSEQVADETGEPVFVVRLD